MKQNRFCVVSYTYCQFILCLFAILLNGCLHPQLEDTDATTFIEVTEKASNENPTPASSDTNIAAQTITDTVSTQLENTRACATHTNAITISQQTGNLIGIFFGEPSIAFIESLTSNLEWTRMPNSEHVGGDLSPNMRLLALLVPDQENGNFLRIITPTGEVLKEVHLDINLQRILWFNNDYLTLIPQGRSSPRFLFNPFTEESQPLPDIPNQETNELFVDVFWFNQDANQVVYLQTDEDFHSYYSSEKYVIYHLDTSERIETELGWVTGGVAWSHQGDRIAVVSPDDRYKVGKAPVQEVFIINNHTGEWIQLTNFVEAHGGVSIQGLSWSPNGRFLLIDVDPIESTSPRSFERFLYIADLESNTLTDLCLNGVVGGSFYWSLDSSLVSWKESGNLHILEVETGLLFQEEAAQMGLLGWGQETAK